MKDAKKIQEPLSVSEVSRLTGVSVRTLRYYDEIGLLPPTEVTPAGYRLYGEEALHRLQCILLYRELEFSLKEISEMMESSDFDRSSALDRQIELLQQKKTHIESLITLAKEIRHKGGNQLDFSAFDVKQIESYEHQAKETWGGTEAYKEYEKKSSGRSRDDNRVLAMGLMDIFAGFGRLRDLPPSDERVQTKVRDLQDYITENYYTCSDEILLSLGAAYSAGGEMQRNIDKYAGEGTAGFVTRAINFRFNGEEKQSMNPDRS